jgi:hypothetical protein
MQDPNTLRALFHAGLEAEARRNVWGLEARVLWILDHLDEYLERWLGFAALQIDPHALLRSDLFTVVEIAVVALEEEFARNTSAATGTYLERIRGDLESLRKHGDEASATSIKARVAELRSDIRITY